MGSHSAHQLRIIFIPFISPGHMIPIVDLARLFARHGIDSIIITTAANANNFQRTIVHDVASGFPIRIHIVPFPHAQVGIPKGIENFTAVTSFEMAGKLFISLPLLQKPFEEVVQDVQPDCIISDMYYPWTVDLADSLGIPRLFFQGSSYFALCAEFSVESYEPHKDVKSDTDKFVLPGLPDRIEMTKMKLPDWVKIHTWYTDVMDAISKSQKRSYGAVMNSFVELEGAYEETYRNFTGLKTWSVGPVSLWANTDVSDKVARGNAAYIGEHECLKWLDEKKPRSVLYVSFGSLTSFSAAQLIEIAHGLESSGHSFIWVVRRKKDEENVAWLPKGFKESKLGLIIEGWAPQLLILDHPAIGGLVTHCGWNSILEGINSGLPMITWPQFAEQFYNERLVVDVLKIGVAVGVQTWCEWGHELKELVKREKISQVVTFLMGHGGEVEEIRKRAMELRNKANKAVEKCGSSESSLLALIDDLKYKSKMRNMT